MTKSLQNELRFLSPAWLVCVLLPLPLILFWRSSPGSSYALMCFFLGCSITTAYSFRRDILPPTSQPNKPQAQTWRQRMFALLLALLAASFVFSTLSLAINDPHDWVVPFLAFMLLVPVLCIVPCMVLITRNSLAGIVFSIILVGSIKTPIGAGIVKIFFPAYFEQALDIDGTRIMPTPWVHPNLLIWIFYCLIAFLSAICFVWGAYRFRKAQSAA